MFDVSTWKSWITPLTTFTFVVVALTGVMMLCDVHFPHIKGFHEWIGLAFAVAGAVHLIIHWRTFCTYLTRRETLLALASVAVLMAVLLFAGDEQKGPHGPNGRHGGPATEEVAEQ